MMGCEGQAMLATSFAKQKPVLAGLTEAGFHLRSPQCLQATVWVQQVAKYSHPVLSYSKCPDRNSKKNSRVPATTSEHLLILLGTNLWLGLTLAFLMDLEHPLSVVSQIRGQGREVLSASTHLQLCDCVICQGSPSFLPRTSVRHSAAPREQEERGVYLAVTC